MHRAAITPERVMAEISGQRPQSHAFRLWRLQDHH
jgi:hypothetical protein